MLKSHDGHIFMEQLLPLAIHTTLPTEVSVLLIELCSFFRQLCGKVLKVEDLEKNTKPNYPHFMPHGNDISSIILHCYGSLGCSPC